MSHTSGEAICSMLCELLSPVADDMCLLFGSKYQVSSLSGLMGCVS